MRELSLHRTASVVQTRSEEEGMTVKTTRALAALVAVLGLLVLPVTAVAQGSYSPVTDQRLVQTETENWPQIRGQYQGGGDNTLSPKTPRKVRRVTPVSALSTRQ